MVFHIGLRSTLFFLLTSIIASIVYGVPLQDQQDSQFSRRASTLAITGLKSSGTHQRLEIRQLQKNTPQWNLFLLALNRFQGMSQSDRSSYYQVSGIHGRPFVPWDGVQLQQSAGYCTHEIVLFPTWHRPYLALYEQILYGIVQQVANEMTQDKSTYVAAAKTFRIPYWDWAAPAQGGQVYPSFFKGIWTGTQSYLDLSLPNGTTRIVNPLYAFKFHPLSASDLPNNPFDIWKTTLRYPSSKTASATSRNDAVAAQILQSQPSYSQRFMNILQVYWKFEHFGNEGWIPNSPGTYDSLESIHDQIHGLVGNGGHMAIIDYSAFDPIFWLHHANVDRLFAIWQAIYPNNWMPAKNQIKYGTGVLKAGQNVDTNTPLAPFHKDTSGNFWTSSSARYTTTFGYTYPETDGATVSSAKAAVNKLYGPSSGKKITKKRAMQATGSSSSSSPSPATTNKALAAAVAAGVAPSAAKSATVATAPQELGPGYYREWITNLRVEKMALQSAFFIHIFLGDFNPDPSCWSFEPNLVGSHAVFTPFTNASTALDSGASSIVTGTIPLTRTLQAHADDGKIDLDDCTAVEKYLRKNLHWRVTRMDDTYVPSAEVQDLKVSVVSSVVKEAEALDEFPVWGDFTVHPGVTEGRDGGLCEGDDS